MREEQIDLSTAERQLLFDIRSESRKTNELLTQLLNAVLCPIAKDIEPKIEVKKVKPKAVKPKDDKPKRGIKNAKIK